MQPLVMSTRKDIHKRKWVLGMGVWVVKAEKMYLVTYNQVAFQL